jgi:putative glutamine amidotransferase
MSLAISVIGITLNYDYSQDRYWLPRDYCRCIQEAGAIPVIIPPDADDQSLSLISVLDGLVLSGGVDVSPLFYGEEPKPGLGDIDVLRDAWEIKLIREALRVGLPLLGICRGLQVLNVAMGGGVIQNLSGSTYLQHMQQAPRRYPSHTVTIHPATRLAELLGPEEVLAVNSLHHQAICEVAPGLQVCALASDGVVEAVESTGSSFVLAVQWHPENLDHPAARALFKALVQATTEGG